MWPNNSRMTNKSHLKEYNQQPMYPKVKERHEGDENKRRLQTDRVKSC